MNGKYDEIMNLPHHVSKTRPQMPISDRAAQFSPFAALTGHDEAIAETARLTDEMVQLDPNAVEILNDKLCRISESTDTEPTVTITYFVPDEKKSGGAYVSRTGTVKKIDEYEHKVIFTDRTSIAIDSIRDIEIDGSDRI